MNITIENIKNILVVLIFLCINFSHVFGLSQLTQIDGFRLISQISIILAGILLIVLYIFIGRYTQKECIIIASCIAIAIPYYINTFSFTLFTTIIAFLTVKGVEKKKIFKYNLYTIAIPFVLVILSSIVGITSIGYREAAKVNGMDFSAYAFGFFGGNGAADVLFVMIASYNLMKNVILKKSEYIIEIFIAFLMWIAFGSRTGTLSLSIYIILMWIIPKLMQLNFSKHIIGLARYIFLIGSILSCYAVYNYNGINEAWYDLNMLLSYRLSLWHDTVMYYGANLFGNDLHDLSVPLDNGYVYILLSFGIIVFVLYNFIFFYVANVCYHYQYWMGIATIIAYAIYAFSETVPLVSTFCNILLLFGCIVLNKTSISNSKDI